MVVLDLDVLTMFEICNSSLCLMLRIRTFILILLTAVRIEMD